MSNKKPSNLGFRPARIDEDVQAKISKEETTRLNVEIPKHLATNLKMQAVREDKTMKELVIAMLETHFK